MKNLCSGTQCGGFQFLLILDLWSISFHAVIVFGLGKNFLFKSALGFCAYGLKFIRVLCFTFRELQVFIECQKAIDIDILFTIIIFFSRIIKIPVST